MLNPNMKNLEDDVPFQLGDFWGSMLIFPGCSFFNVFCSTIVVGIWNLDEFFHEFHRSKG